jgi:hypothetical protein
LRASWVSKVLHHGVKYKGKWVSKELWRVVEDKGDGRKMGTGTT